ncbi:UNVERIFIED_CONTAM: hypothetical protein GTU68_010688 [Idotea baltica]|nr:hypothetical protein [Idotea baltica]
MAVTAAAVKALREKTDLPMMDCKKALVEADGDEAKAIEILKEAFKKIQVKRADNATEEGRIFVKTSDDGKQAVIVEVQCESSPGKGEGKNPEILRDVAMHIAALVPTVALPADLDVALVQEERDRLSAEAKATGKPDNIIEKIVDGRMKQWFAEKGVLAMQPFAKDDSKTVSQALAEAGYEVTGFTRWTIGGGE